MSPLQRPWVFNIFAKISRVFFYRQIFSPTKTALKKKTVFLEGTFSVAQEPIQKGFFPPFKKKRKPAPFGCFFSQIGWCDSKKARWLSYPRCKLAYGKQESKSGIHVSKKTVEKKHPGSYKYTKPPFRNPAVAVLEPWVVYWLFKNGIPYNSSL